jgi:hypothetical protein
LNENMRVAGQVVGYLVAQIWPSPSSVSKINGLVSILLLLLSVLGHCLLKPHSTGPSFKSSTHNNNYYYDKDDSYDDRGLPPLPPQQPQPQPITTTDMPTLTTGTTTMIQTMTTGMNPMTTVSEMTTVVMMARVMKTMTDSMTQHQQ